MGFFPTTFKQVVRSMVQAVYAGCLLIIAITWLAGWRIGRRWTGACGVTERAGLWSLACVLPTAGLI
ncbi:MAG: hypothetical protein V3W34_06155, partial [Phycisphaerae bacterium]